MSLPRFTRMPLARLREPFDHSDWLFELKFDGFRSLCYLEAGKAELVSRNANTFKNFGGLCEAMAVSLSGISAAIDGEIVCLDDSGKPQFNALLFRHMPQYFAAFDLLHLNGRDLRRLPLIEPKELLRTLIPAQPAPVFYVDYVEARGVDLFRAVCDADLEGIVAKRRDGPYTPHETSWAKIKNRGYSQAVGRHELFERRKAKGA